MQPDSASGLERNVHPCRRREACVSRPPVRWSL